MAVVSLPLGLDLLYAELIFELPQVIWALPALIGAIASIWSKRWRDLGWHALALSITLYLMAPSWGSPRSLPQGESIRVLTVNVQHLQGDLARVEKFLRSHDADVVLLQEAGEIASDRRFRAFPDRQVYVSENVAFATRHPVEDFRELRFARLLKDRVHAREFGPNVEDHGVAQIAKVRIGGKAIHILNTHLTPNGYARDRGGIGERVDLYLRSSRYRRAQIEVLNREIAKLEGPIVFGGDLNQAPLGSNYRRLCSRLKDTWREVGRGFGNTIDPHLPWKRIDYLLSNEEAIPLHAKVVGPTGSDHLGYLVEFKIAGD